MGANHAANEAKEHLMDKPFDKAKANEIKHRLRTRGQTLKSWCEANGYSYGVASNVLRGINRATFGQGREIAEKLVRL